MTARKTKVGGLRPGPGRPPIANPRTVKRAVPLQQSEADAHDAARGEQPWADWIREAASDRIARDLSVSCPHCGASPKDHCRTAGGVHVPAHRARTKWRAATTDATR